MVFVAERDVHEGRQAGYTLPSLPPEVRVVAANGDRSAAACHPRQRLIGDCFGHDDPPQSAPGRLI
jgi:hypothetical protein